MNATYGLFSDIFSFPTIVKILDSWEKKKISLIQSPFEFQKKDSNLDLRKLISKSVVIGYLVLQEDASY